MLPGRYARVRSQIWQRVTGRWVTVTGKRREREVLITSHEASPPVVTLPPCWAERAPRGRCAHSRQVAMDTYAGRAVAQRSKPRIALLQPGLLPLTCPPLWTPAHI